MFVHEFVQHTVALLEFTCFTSYYCLRLTYVRLPSEQYQTAFPISLEFEVLFIEC